MYTFGYLREATQAHIDLDEQEIQAMNLQERYYIFANEAMQAICSVKPKYEYFICKIVKEYDPIINLGDNQFRKATEEELHGLVRSVSFADEVDTIKWYESQNIYLVNKPVKMPDEFLAFADKQAWAFIHEKAFDSELFITGSWIPKNPVPDRIHAGKSHYKYTGRNTLTFIVEGEFWIPYKAIWHRFKSGIGDQEVIDMPVDIFLAIPLYVSAQFLQIDHIQRAQSKRAEFEAALARAHATDFMELKTVSPTFK